MAFLARSSCLLTTLSIEILAFADLKLIDLVTHLPTLLNLSIDDSDVAPGCSPITDRFIESLQVHETGSMVPRLHSLKLNVGASTFNDGIVVDMVRSRWIIGCASRESEPQVDRLREFTIRFRNREESKAAYESLEDVERDGMRAVVLWKNHGLRRILDFADSLSNSSDDEED
ncbi:hypothetical protein BT96DRAFT_1015398 [Gymnopus androsaceus JB14]|uniref:F-box domain-containing protein n=1 Tax=Gymnopus androsaceus JB14 TaxID=1447944 RepID=A0A6A4I4K7_9AGAR|nr:hypothetical protein BT96DRAFT_1015398 [Gymnopus androsaceus JB14]